MSIRSDLGTPDAIIEVCTQHLGRQFVEEYDFFLSPGWFLDVELVQAANKKAQAEALKEIQKSLSNALRQLNTLHPSVKRAMEWQVLKNLTSHAPNTKLTTFTEIDGERVPFQSYDNLEVMIRTALSSFLGLPVDTPELEFKQDRSNDSALSAANVSMSEASFQDITYQQRDGETWQKALTAKRCRDFWQLAKGDEAPKTASGQFSLFLGDVVYALDKGDNWTSLPALMRAWSKCAENDERFR
ncbi:MAG: hypothetical protein AB3N07_10925 [Ruegeria sp.]